MALQRSKGEKMSFDLTSPFMFVVTNDYRAAKKSRFVVNRAAIMN